jgi:hypothetical protein
MSAKALELRRVTARERLTQRLEANAHRLK